jgi:hypothetical protein
MTVALLIFTIIGSSVALIVAVSGLAWWAYRRGVADGVRQAELAGDRTRVENFVRALAQTRAELAVLQPRPRD